MNGSPDSLGRPHHLADHASMTDFGDCVRVDLRWNDGAYVYELHDSKEEAVAHLNRLGFYQSLPNEGRAA